MQGAPVKFIQPDTPFKYLGIYLTLTLDWKHQYKAMLAAVKEKCRAMSNRCLPAGVQMKVIRTVIKPMITYSFGVAPYTPAQLKVLDAQLARTAKAAYKQRVSMSTALAMEDVDKFGLGLTSLLVEYTHTCIRNLVTAANDATAYGCVSKSLLAFQASRTGGLNETQLHGVASSFMRVRQLSAVQQSGLRILNQSTMEEMALDGTDIVRLVTSLALATTELGLPAFIPCRLVQPLTALGMHKVEDLLTKDYKQVISRQALRLRYGRTATSAHIQALYRIAYILHMEDTPHIPRVKRMHFTDAAVSYNAYRVVHPVHREAMIRASQSNTDQVFSNILKPMPRKNHSSEDITKYMAPPQARTGPMNAEPELAQPSKRHRPGTRTKSGTKKSEQRTILLQTTRRRRASRQKNEHRVKLDDACCTTRASADQAMQAPAVLTRHERARKLYEQKGARAALNQCTDTIHTVQRIVGWRLETNHKNKNWLKRKATEASSQAQYLVEWAPTLEEAWAVQAYKDLGYTPLSVAPITMAAIIDDPTNQDLFEQIACEVCNHKHDTAMIICDECDRGYHKACLPHEQFSEEAEEAPLKWQCDYCNRTSTQRRTRGRCPGDTKIQLLKVTWAPTWEPGDSIPGDMTTAYNDQIQQQQRACRKRPDDDCTDLEKQGIHGHNTYIGHMSDTARLNVTINHQPVDPYTDIVPVNAYTLNFRQVVRTTATKHAVHHQRSLTACSAGLDGRCVGKICSARLQILWDRYNHTVNTKPDMVEHLHIHSFEEEVHHLLLRYKDGATVHTGKANRVVNMKNHWATPPAIMACLQRHMHITTERFASPLNFHHEMISYYSCHERDQVFGATWNAFSVKWTGLSQCNPEYEHGDMEKAVRWALNSATKTTAAVLTVCVLPAWDENSNTAYNRMIADHPAHCHVIMRIPKRNFKFCTPDAWNGEDTYAGCPKWDVNFLLIGNEQGYATITPADERALCLCVAQELRTLMSRNDATTLRGTDACITGFRSLSTRPRCNASVETSIANKILAGKTFRYAADEHSCVALAPAPAAHGNVSDIFAARHPLCADPHAMVYTDGSVITSEVRELDANVGSKRMRLETTTTTVAGAGIYVPRALVTENIVTQLNKNAHNSAFETCGDEQTAGVAISLDPGGVGATNTITRAEGAAIWYALREGLGTTIATDSAAVLYQIRNMLHRPARMQHCKNKSLIEEIVGFIRASPHHIHLQKVKAHTGIPGNELADEAARHATRLAQYRQDDMPQCDTDPMPPSHTQFWPVPTDADATNSTSRQPKHHIGDLGKDLKKYLHEKHRVGYSNTSSVYYQAWARTVNIAHKGHSNLLMQSNRVDPQDRITTLQYRYGGLNTAKMRHRMKVAPTANCILCGQLDGGHHSMSGCPHMSGMYTERHNVGGRILLKALLKGGRGADIVMHDIGHAADASMLHDVPKSQGSFATRIPEWVYTKGRRSKPSANEKNKWDRYRPDILMIAGTNKKSIKRREVDVVEIKYCRDTDPTMQQSRAEMQHDATASSSDGRHNVSLMQSLRDTGYRPSKIRLHVILLGVGGTIYSSMHTTLQQLGLKKQASAIVAGKLHKHATVYARKIMQTKWNQEFILKRDAG